MNTIAIFNVTSNMRCVIIDIYYNLVTVVSESLKVTATSVT